MNDFLSDLPEYFRAGGSSSLNTEDREAIFENEIEHDQKSLKESIFSSFNPRVGSKKIGDIPFSSNITSKVSRPLPSPKIDLTQRNHPIPLFLETDKATVQQASPTQRKQPAYSEGIPHLKKISQSPPNTHLINPLEESRDSSVELWCDEDQWVKEKKEEKFEMRFSNSCSPLQDFQDLEIGIGICTSNEPNNGEILQLVHSKKSTKF